MPGGFSMLALSLPTCNTTTGLQPWPAGTICWPPTMLLSLQQSYWTCPSQQCCCRIQAGNHCLVTVLVANIRWICWEHQKYSSQLPIRHTDQAYPTQWGKIATFVILYDFSLASRLIMATLWASKWPRRRTTIQPIYAGSGNTKKYSQLPIDHIDQAYPTRWGKITIPLSSYLTFPWLAEHKVSWEIRPPAEC